MKPVSEEFTKKELYEVAKLLEVKIVSKATKTYIVSAINKRIDEMNEGYLQPVVNPLGDNGLESASVDVDKVSDTVVEPSKEVVQPVKKVKANRGNHPITGLPV